MLKVGEGAQRVFVGLELDEWLGKLDCGPRTGVCDLNQKLQAGFRLKRLYFTYSGLNCALLKVLHNLVLQLCIIFPGPIFVCSCSLVLFMKTKFEHKTQQLTCTSAIEAENSARRTSV